MTRGRQTARQTAQHYRRPGAATQMVQQTGRLAKLTKVRVALLNLLYGHDIDQTVLLTDIPKPGSARFYPAGTVLKSE